jgi:hypothetical protein
MKNSSIKRIDPLSFFNITPQREKGRDMEKIHRTSLRNRKVTVLGFSEVKYINYYKVQINITIKVDYLNILINNN